MDRKPIVGHDSLMGLKPKSWKTVAPLRPTFTWIWVFLGTAALLTELAALFSKPAGGTLSEHVWTVLRVGDQRPSSAVWAGRIALAAFLLWLLPHFGLGWFTTSDPLPW